MKRIFLKILELARPYYEEGRSYDLPQIDWMVRVGVDIAEKEGMNEDLLLPIIILHDVGYSRVNNKNPNIKDKEIKKEHMIKGAEIARQILDEINYDSELSKLIVYYISVHDNWLFGDNKPFLDCDEMALFNDLDFLAGIRDKEMFELRANSMGISPEEMYTEVFKEEKLINRPFCCVETKNMFDDFMKKRKEELEN